MNDYDKIIKSANETMIQLNQIILELHEEIDKLKKDLEEIKNVSNWTRNTKRNIEIQHWKY